MTDLPPTIVYWYCKGAWHKLAQIVKTQDGLTEVVDVLYVVDCHYRNVSERRCERCMAGEPSVVMPIQSHGCLVPLGETPCRE